MVMLGYVSFILQTWYHSQHNDIKINLLSAVNQTVDVTVYAYIYVCVLSVCFNVCRDLVMSVALISYSQLMTDWGNPTQWYQTEFRKDW